MKKFLLKTAHILLLLLWLWVIDVLLYMFVYWSPFNADIAIKAFAVAAGVIIGFYVSEKYKEYFNKN